MLTAIMRYPPSAAGTEPNFEYRRNWFTWAFIGIVITDILRTAGRGDVFSPWYYLPFVSHYVLLALTEIFVQRAILHRWLPWLLLMGSAFWSFVVGKFLV